MNMINLMQRLAELDAKNPNMVKEEGGRWSQDNSGKWSEKHPEKGDSQQIRDKLSQIEKMKKEKAEKEKEEEPATESLRGFRDPFSDKNKDGTKVVDKQKESSMSSDDLTLESIRLLSGLKTKMAESGILMPDGLSGPSSIPASVNITAANGPELTGMLKDIMSLAGVKPVTQDDMPVDHVAGAPSELDDPLAATDVARPGEPDMKSLISIMDKEPEAELDSMNDIENDGSDDVEDEGMLGGGLGGMAGGTAGEVAGGAIGTAVGGPVGGAIGAAAGDIAGTAMGSKEGDKLTGENSADKIKNRPYDNSPKEKMGQDGVRQFGDTNSGSGKDRTGVQPNAKTFEEALYADYKKFMAEAKNGPDKKDIPAFQRKAKGGDWKVSKKDLEDEKKSRNSDSKTLAANKKAKGMNEETVDDFKAKGGKVTSVPYKEPKKSQKANWGSKHIGGQGEAKKGKAGQTIGLGANTNFKGKIVKPVVTNSKRPKKSNEGLGDDMLNVAKGMKNPDGTPRFPGAKLRHGPQERRPASTAPQRSAPYSGPKASGPQDWYDQSSGGKRNMGD